MHDKIPAMNPPAVPPAQDALSPVLTVPRSPGTPPAIPDYDLVRGIGAGSYGEVWLARSTATGVLRAVKLVYRATFGDERPFQREFEGILKFEAVSRAHPSQLALFHVGRNEAAGYFYYVMELADDVNAEGGTRNAELAPTPASASSIPHSVLRFPTPPTPFAPTSGTVAYPPLGCWSSASP